MPKDRLNDLRTNDNRAFVSSQVDVGMQPGGSFDESNRIRDDIETLKQYVEAVDKLQSRILNASGTAENELRNELEDRMAQTKVLISKIRRDIKAMAIRINQEQLTRPASEMRIEKAQYTTLSTLFSEWMKRYNQIQTTYFESSKKRFQRQLEITGVHKTEEEVNEMIHSGNVQIFTQGVLAETKMARQALADVEARHREIMKLERDIIELQEMFVDFSAMIEDQGQMINRIEDNMVKADLDVEEGHKVLPEAVKNKKAATKKKLIVIGIIVAVVAIIVILLAVILSSYLKH